MNVRITRLNEATTVVRFERSDGSIVETRSPGGRHRLPHDLMHYVVESELGLDDGLWGRIHSGVTYSNFRVLRAPSKKRSHARRARRHTGRRKGVLEAEVLVGVFHDIWEGTAEREWGSIRAFLDATWSPRTRSRAEEVDEETIQRVCAALNEAASAWNRVPLGGELCVQWPAAPRSERPVDARFAVGRSESAS
jgi:hypothetical protein